MHTKTYCVQVFTVGKSSVREAIVTEILITWCKLVSCGELMAFGNAQSELSCWKESSQVGPIIYLGKAFYNSHEIFFLE